METFLGTLFIVICILLILIVLLQKGRGGGLGAAFGGAGSSAFGTRTGDVFTWVTIVLTALFLILGIVTTVTFRPPKETVEIKALEPPAGTPIAEETTVRATCQPGDAELRYTLDGTDPTKQSAKYSKTGVRVAPGQTLKLRGYSPRCHTSTITVAEYPPPKPPEPKRPPTATTRSATGPATTRAATKPAATTGPATKPAATTGPATKPAATTRAATKPATKPVAATRPR